MSFLSSQFQVINIFFINSARINMNELVLVALLDGHNGPITCVRVNEVIFTIESIT
jgi:hypothetical protein